jgi:hypothetical protein
VLGDLRTRVFDRVLALKPFQHDDRGLLQRTTDIAIADLAKTAPAALRIFDTIGKTTLATLFANKRHQAKERRSTEASLLSCFFA